MFIKTLQLQGMLFIIMLMGVVLNKCNIIDKSSNKNLTDILLYLILPCSILMSFQTDITQEVLKSSLIVLLIGFFVEIFSLLLSKVLFNKFPKNQKVVLQYGLIVSNASFMGLVVMEGILGPKGLLYGSISLIALRIFVWSAGLSLFTETSKKEMIRSVITHPCVITVIIGFMMMYFEIKFPQMIATALKNVGNCTTAISMIIIGNTLAGVKPSSIISKPILYFCMIRLVIMPILVYLSLAFTNIDPIIIGVAIISAAMPAGSTTAILAEKYNCDSEFAVKCVFSSTLLSLVTIPVISLFLI